MTPPPYICISPLLLLVSLFRFTMYRKPEQGEKLREIIILRLISFSKGSVLVRQSSVSFHDSVAGLPVERPELRPTFIAAAKHHKLLSLQVNLRTPLSKTS